MQRDAINSLNSEDDMLSSISSATNKERSGSGDTSDDNTTPNQGYTSNIRFIHKISHTIELGRATPWCDSNDFNQFLCMLCLLFYSFIKLGVLNAGYLYMTIEGN